MNSKIKILILALTLALLVCAAVGITSSATDDTAPKIISQNVEYGGNYALVYAVAADSVKGTDVTLEVYENASCTGDALFSKTIDATAENQETVRGVACYVFTTNGIPAKNMDTQYYVKVSSAGNATVMKYSVAEYLFERLYKNGVAFSTDAAEVKRAELYNTILLYGKQAQDVLFNLDSNPENDKTTFVTDMKYVYFDGDFGLVDDYDSGIFAEGSTVTFKTVGSAKLLALFDAESGELLDTVRNGDSFTVNSHIKVVNSVRGSGDYADYSTQYTDKAFSDLTNFTTVGSAVPASIVSIDGNDALKFYAASSSHGYARYSIAKEGTDNAFVFESDFMLENYSSSAARSFHLMPTSNLGGNASIYSGYIIIAYDSTRDAYVVRTSDISIENGYVLTQGEWFNLRVEYGGVTAGSSVDLYVNGELISSSTLAKSISGLVGYQFQILGDYEGNTGVKGSVYLDNTYLGSVISKGELGGGKYAESALTYKDKNLEALTDDGSIVEVQENATVSVVESNGNDVLKVDFDATAWARYTFASQTTGHTDFVFETDISFRNTEFTGSGRIFYLRGTSDNAAHANYDLFGCVFYQSENGDLVVQLSKDASATYTFKEGEWINLRLEADALASDTVRLIVNGVTVGEYNFSIDISDITGVQLMCSSPNENGSCKGDIYFDNTYVGAKID